MDRDILGVLMYIVLRHFQIKSAWLPKTYICGTYTITMLKLVTVGL